jgi:hypothetical protein
VVVDEAHRLFDAGANAHLTGPVADLLAAVARRPTDAALRQHDTPTAAPTGSTR